LLQKVLFQIPSVISPVKFESNNTDNTCIVKLFDCRDTWLSNKEGSGNAVSCGCDISDILVII